MGGHCLVGLYSVLLHCVQPGSSRPGKLGWDCSVQLRPAGTQTLSCVGIG